MIDHLSEVAVLAYSALEAKRTLVVAVRGGPSNVVTVKFAGAREITEIGHKGVSAKTLFL